MIALSPAPEPPASVHRPVSVPVQPVDATLSSLLMRPYFQNELILRGCTAIKPKQVCFFFESALKTTKPSRLQQNGLPAKCCVDQLTAPRFTGLGAEIQFTGHWNPRLTKQAPRLLSLRNIFRSFRVFCSCGECPSNNMSDYITIFDI